MSDENIERLTERVNELEARLREQRATAIFAAVAAALLLACGIFIGHSLRGETTVTAPQPVVVTVAMPTVSAPAPPAPPPMMPSVTAEPTAKATPLAPSAPAAVVPVVPVTTAKRAPVDHGF